MKLTAVLCLITLFAAAAATEEQPNKRAAVVPGSKLVVDVDSGAIVLTTNATGRITEDVWHREHSREET